MKVLELSEVTKRFGDVVAVDAISFHVAKGQITCLLGPSGCGKTTTLRLIAGFEQADGGTVTIGGTNMRNQRPYERNVGLLFQDYALFPHMTVLENIRYGLRHRGFPKDQVTSRAAEMLTLVKLDGLERRRPEQLSGGQQQRVALARALATDPEILLLDEPLSALDAKLRDELRVELKDILAQVGTTTIVVTHDQEEAMSLGDSIIVMDEGRIVQEGTAAEIYAHPANPFVADFVGRSNWLEGSIIARKPAERLSIRIGTGQTITAQAAFQKDTDTCEVFIRPERISLSIGDENGDDPEDDRLNVLPGAVREVFFLGSDVQVIVDLGKGLRILVVDQSQHAAGLKSGQTVKLRFDPADCLLFECRI